MEKSIFLPTVAVAPSSSVTGEKMFSLFPENKLLLQNKAHMSPSLLYIKYSIYTVYVYINYDLKGRLVFFSVLPSADTVQLGGDSSLIHVTASVVIKLNLIGRPGVLSGATPSNFHISYD